MKIIYFVSQFPKLSESFVINEIYELKKRGHTVSIFAITQTDEEIVHKELQNIDLTVHYAEQPSLQSLPDLLSHYILNPTVLRQAAFVDEPRYHASCLHLGKQLIEFIESEGSVDLIHSHFAVPNRIAVTYAAAYYDIPCTITAHAYEIFSNPDIQRLQRLFLRFDHVIVPSKYNREFLREKFGVNTEMTVVPATTDANKFDQSGNCISGRLLTVARLVEKKGHKYMIDAVAKLIKQGYDIEYHIIGSGEQEQFLRDRVYEFGIESYVEFLGHVSDDRLKSELYDAELFVLPCVIASDGDRDVAPVALKEAMATRTACVSTTVSAIPELITDGYDGILVEPNDSEVIAKAVAELLDNPAQRKRLAKNARKTIETKFDIRSAVDQLENLFITLT